VRHEPAWLVATVAPRSKQPLLTELTDERSGNRVRVASWEYEPDAGGASVFAGPYNVGRLSGGEAPDACGGAARRLPQLTKKSAGAICKRRDAVRLGRKKALQRRER
jgi:hypothetical protein